MSGKPIAVVYRGPASDENCPQAAAAPLEPHLDIVFAGPDEEVSVAEALRLPNVAVYVQPGGGDDMKVGWNAVKGFSKELREWVKGGGRFVGICMGGYLAGTDPGVTGGFKLLAEAGADSAEYTSMEGADFTDMDDHVIEVTWRGETRQVYYQGGPAFTYEGDASNADVVATYSNGAIAALIVPFGSGAVGVTGPHPEAPQDWLDGAELEGEAVTDLWVQLVQDTVSFGGNEVGDDE